MHRCGERAAGVSEEIRDWRLGKRHLQSFYFQKGYNEPGKLSRNPKEPHMADATTIEQHPPLSEEEVAFLYAEMAKLVTEDDTPVDNIFSERQQRLLTEPLYATAQFP